MCFYLHTFSLLETFDTEEEQLKHYLLHGGFNLNDLPQIHSNVVKLYICASRKGNAQYNLSVTELVVRSQRMSTAYLKNGSPTFFLLVLYVSEFEREREVLMKNVYPDLRRHFRDNHGVDFHVSWLCSKGLSSYFISHDIKSEIHTRTRF